MKRLFKDKVVIVTGASSGIGEATAREFALNGSKVVLAARTESKLAEITKEINSSGGEAFYVSTDVSIENDCKKLIEKTIEKYGRIDILVNNAGLSMRASFIDVDVSVLHRLMNVNFGVQFIAQNLLYLISLKAEDRLSEFHP
jgi:NADP-dependent 3-hydroxy acid dehydrogenase YdfG